MKSLPYSIFLIISLLQTGVLHAQSHYDWWPIDRSIMVKFVGGVPVFHDHLGLSQLSSNTPSYATYTDSGGKMILFGNEELIVVSPSDTINLLSQPPYFIHMGGLNQGNIVLPMKHKYDEESESDSILLFYLHTNVRHPTTVSNATMSYTLISIVKNYDTINFTSIPSVPLVEDHALRTVTAIRHANGIDWWVIAPIGIELYERTNSFWIARLSPLGILDTSIQNIGKTISYINYSQLSVSPKGNQLAHVSGREVQLFDFDRCIGKLSNARVIEDSLVSHYGCAFSSDGSKLYVSTHIPKLFQYDLTTPDFVKTELFSGVGPGQSNFYEGTQLQRGPDNKIYMGFLKFGFWPYPYGEDPSQYLMAVTNPNAAGADVVLDTFAVWLGGYYNHSHGLPNFVNYDLGPLEGSDCDSTGGGSTVVENPGEIISDWQVQPTVSSGLYVFSGPTNTILTAYDVWGRLVWRDTYSGSGIDLSAIPPGLYLLHASSESQQQMFKIIRQ